MELLVLSSVTKRKSFSLIFRLLLTLMPQKVLYKNSMILRSSTLMWLVYASAQDLIDDANRAKVAKAKLTLERVGILKPTVSAATPTPRTRLVISLKPKDWRRI